MGTQERINHKIDYITKAIYTDNPEFKDCTVYCLSENDLDGMNNEYCKLESIEEYELKGRYGLINLHSESDFKVNYLRKVNSLSEVRGHKIISNNIFEYGTKSLDSHGFRKRMNKHRYYFGVLGNRFEWINQRERDVYKRRENSEYIGQSVRGTYMMIANYECFRDYAWWTSIQKNGGPKLMLPTTPEISREVFKLRDIPEDKQRRPMIRNIISSHFRHYENKIVEVDKHLRGRVDFKWRGYDISIYPPKDIL